MPDISCLKRILARLIIVTGTATRVKENKLERCGRMRPLLLERDSDAVLGCATHPEECQLNVLRSRLHGSGWRAVWNGEWVCWIS